jgi:glycosyltransferase involved in cell wall biosynthesis
MASGLPVIATAVGGNAELVEAEVSGSLVPPSDPQALAECMAAYAADQALRVSRGQAAGRRITESFSMARMLAAYAGVYDQLMETRGIAH